MAENAPPYITPIVRRRAADLGVDLSTVAGTGVGGRIRVQDVEDAAALRAGQHVSPHVEESPKIAVHDIDGHDSQSFSDVLLGANLMDASDVAPDVLLGTDTGTRQPIFLPYNDRPKGVAIIGKAGTGKSSLLEHLILADLEHGTPGMVIDPHGLLVQRIMQFATPEQASRIILLEAARNAPFGLNLLAVRNPVDRDDDPVSWAADSVVATIKKLYGEDDEFLPRLERYLDLCARTLIPSRLTLLDAPRLFEDTSFRQECLSRVIDAKEQQALRRSWAAYDKLRPGEQITHTEALVNRLERLLAPPVIRGIVGSRETTVPFDQILSGDRMLLVSLPSDRLSPERCDFIGAMLLCALADRIFARSVTGATPRRLHVYLDEYQRFATSTTAELLEQGRKYNAGITLAHQTLYQIRDQRIRNAARHAGTLIVLGVTRPDAEQLAGEFPIIPKAEWIETIEEIDGTQPKYVMSPTPADDLYLNGHSDPEVDLAARSFLRASTSVPSDNRDWMTRRRSNLMVDQDGDHLRDPYGYQVHEPDPRSPLPQSRRHKSEGVPRRPGGIPVPHVVQVEAYWINGLLHEAMTKTGLEDPFDFASTLLHANFAHLVYVQDEQFDDGMFLNTAIISWFIKHLENPDALLAGKGAEVFGWADEYLLAGQRAGGHDRVFSSGGRPISIDYARQRLRWLFILCMGLRKQPVLTPSGEQEPRRAKRHIVHSGQTHADALNEVAGRLVHPSERYVAHVRMPQQYHEVRLRPPLDEDGGDRPRVPGPNQPDDIRTRSRALYEASPDQDAMLPFVSVDEPQRRRVTRRPPTPNT